MTDIRVDETTSDLGELHDGYGKVLASAIRGILLSGYSSEPLRVLVGHTAAIPVVHILEKHTSWSKIYIFDDREQNVAFQTGKINDSTRVSAFQCKVMDLPDEVCDLDLVINPFGLQEYPGEEQIYALEARSRSCDNASMFTLDWGLTHYEERLADIPGISDEIRFSESRMTPIFKEGWQLTSQHSYYFFVSHTVDQVEAIMPVQSRPIFRAAVNDEDTIEVHSSAIVRHYCAK